MRVRYIKLMVLTWVMIGIAENGICQTKSNSTTYNDDFLETLFKQNPGKFDSIMLHHIGWIMYR